MGISALFVAAGKTLVRTLWRKPAWGGGQFKSIIRELSGGPSHPGNADSQCQAKKAPKVSPSPSPFSFYIHRILKEGVCSKAHSKSH